MMKKRWKRGGALLLALALALSGTGILKTRAAVAVDTTKKCLLIVDVGDLYTLVQGEQGNSGWNQVGDTSDLYDPDLPSLNGKVEIRLYKVASINASGEYSAVTDDSAKYKFGVLKDDLSEVSSKTNAADWNAMALKAVEVVTNQNAETGEKSLKETEAGLTKKVENGTAVEFDNLEVGLYLVAANPVDTNYYTYKFSPYLVSLPNNYYDEKDPSSSDEWKYDDIKMGLKVEQTPLYGDLNIVKTLTDMNTTFGSGTTFVYQIDITTLKDETETRIEAIEFTGAGKNALTVSDIEAGSTVTVTELYSGAGYKISGSDTAGAVIVADGLEGEPAQVEFTNVPDNTMTGGYGAINHFVQNADGTDYTHSRLDGGAVNAPAE